MTFFLVIDLFHVLMWYVFHRGAKSVSDIDTGEPKPQNPYISTNSQHYHYSFCPRWGPNSIANFDGGPWPDLPPLDPPLCLSTFSLNSARKQYVCCAVKVLLC